MWTDRQFWHDATWRAFRSFCQSLAGLLAGEALTLLTAPWGSMLSIAATAGLLSLLMSIDRGRAVTDAAPAVLTEARAAAAQSTAAAYPSTIEPATVATQPVYGCGDSLR